jgi:hypothetical protein
VQFITVEVRKRFLTFVPCKVYGRKKHMNNDSCASGNSCNCWL